jgi:hypothetical protein
MAWKRMVLPWASIAVLVLSLTASSQASRHKTDTTAATTTARPTLPWSPQEDHYLRPPPQEVKVSVPDGQSHYPAYVFPDALDEETRLPLMTPERNNIGYPNFKVAQWRMDAGGVPSAEAEVDGVRKSMSNYGVTVANKHHERMRVLDVRAVVLQRRPALGGTLLVDTGLSSPTPAAISVDLDQPEGRLVSAPSGRPLLDVNYMTMEEDEVVRVSFSAFASDHDYLWELRWTVQYGGSEPRELVIRSDGTADGPLFQTTAWGRDRPYSGGVHELESGPCCYAG